jgi:hypothetical protein
MSTTMPEQRRVPRVVFISSAIIRYEKGSVMEANVDTRNISLTGLYLETDTRIPVDTPCKIAIQLAGATSKMDFKVEGVICRHDRTGMGITFTHLNPDSYIHIVNLVKLHAAEDQ